LKKISSEIGREIIEHGQKVRGSVTQSDLFTPTQGWYTYNMTIYQPN